MWYRARAWNALDVVELLAAVVRREWRSVLLSIALLLAGEALRQWLRHGSRTPRDSWMLRATTNESPVVVDAVLAASA